MCNSVKTALTGFVAVHFSGVPRRHAVSHSRRVIYPVNSLHLPNVMFVSGSWAGAWTAVSPPEVCWEVGEPSRCLIGMPARVCRASKEMLLVHPVQGAGCEPGSCPLS